MPLPWETVLSPFPPSGPGVTPVIGAALMEFFPDPPSETRCSIGDFIAARRDLFPGQSQPHVISAVCRRLVDLGFLMPAGSKGANPAVDECYCRTTIFNCCDRAYGTIDYLVYGFPLIHERLSAAVRPIFVQMEDETPSVGTGFVLDNRKFATCRHCIEGMRQVTIDGWDGLSVPLRAIYVARDPRVDIAVLEFCGDAFPGVRGFHLMAPTLLEDVMAMGYPQVPGFEPVLVAERAQVAAHIKSATGQIVAEGRAYLDQQEYLLITARVKGGSSGGPVVGRYGKVVGVVSQIPGAEGRADVLGYGMVISSQKICSVLEESATPSGDTTLPFIMRGAGFMTHLLVGD